MQLINGQNKIKEEVAFIDKNFACYTISSFHTIFKPLN